MHINSSVQRENPAVLAAGGLLWCFFRTFEGDVAELIGGEQVCHLGTDRLPYPVRIGTSRRFQADSEIGRGGLHDLEQLDSRRPIHQRRERQRRDGDLFAAFRGEGEHVSSAALDANRRQGATTRARVGAHQDAVAQIVAQNRLHSIGEVGNQDCVRPLARWERLIVRVHRLDHHPVEVRMIPSVCTFRAEKGAFGSTVDIADFGMEQSGKPVVLAGR